MFAVFIFRNSHLCNLPIYISSTKLRSSWRPRFAKIKFIQYCSALNEAHISYHDSISCISSNKYLPFPVFHQKYLLHFSISAIISFISPINPRLYFPPYFSHIKQILVEMMFISSNQWNGEGASILSHYLIRTSWKSQNGQDLKSTRIGWSISSGQLR